MQVAVASAVLWSGQTRRVLIPGGEVVAVTYWVFGQRLVGLSTGPATDVGSGPLLLLLSAALRSALPL